MKVGSATTGTAGAASAGAGDGWSGPAGVGDGLPGGWSMEPRGDRTVSAMNRRARVSMSPNMPMVVSAVPSSDASLDAFPAEVGGP